MSLKCVRIKYTRASSLSIEKPMGWSANTFIQIAVTGPNSLDIHIGFRLVFISVVQLVTIRWGLLDVRNLIYFIKVKTIKCLIVYSIQEKASLIVSSLVILLSHNLNIMMTSWYSAYTLPTCLCLIWILKAVWEVTFYFCINTAHSSIALGD